MSILTTKCPFCGSKDEYLELSSERSIGHNRHFVVCNSCGAKGPNERSDGEAWEQWNERS